MPIFLVDTEGNLLYYNEPAEAILGRRFSETGANSHHERRSVVSWVTFRPSSPLM